MRVSSSSTTAHHCLWPPSPRPPSHRALLQESDRHPHARTDGDCDDASLGGTGNCVRGTDTNDCAVKNHGADAEHQRRGLQSSECSVPDTEYGCQARSNCHLESHIEGSYCRCTVPSYCPGSTRAPPPPPGSCPFTNDGQCDEPSICAYGTDTNDCRGYGRPPPPPPYGSYNPSSSSSSTYSSSGSSYGSWLVFKWFILIPCCLCLSSAFKQKPPAAAAPCAQGGQCVVLTKAKVRAGASTNSAEVGTIQCVYLLSRRSRACTPVARAFADSTADWRVVAAAPCIAAPKRW
jgi:hypothetical protein